MGLSDCPTSSASHTRSNVLVIWNFAHVLTTAVFVSWNWWVWKFERKIWKSHLKCRYSALWLILRKIASNIYCHISFEYLKEFKDFEMLYAPVFIFTSGSSAPLGRPRCGLSIWLSLLAIFNTLFWLYANLFHEKTDKTRKYWKSAIFLWYKDGRRRLLGAQSINTESASLKSSNDEFWKWWRHI